MITHTPHRLIPATLRGALVIGAVVYACAPLRPPAQNSGQTISTEGVEFGVTRQSCTQTKDPDQPGDDLVEEVVEIELRSPVATSLALQRDAFRLVTPDGFALRTITWGSAEPITIAGGETRTFALRFMTRGSLQCAGPMRLEPRDAVRQAGSVVDLRAVTFTPSRET
jgi:hypothetical protein